MSESLIRVIENCKNTVVGTIQQQMQQLISVLSPLAKLPQLVDTAIKNMMSGFGDNIRAQMLIAIAEQRGKVGSHENQIREELQQVEKVRERISQRAEEVEYESVKELDKLDKSCAHSVNQLDGPVLDLARKVFPQNIGGPLSDTIVPFWSLLTGLGKGSAASRSTALEDNISDFNSRLTDLKKEMSAIRAKTESYRHSRKCEDIEIPYLVFEVEHAGKTEQKIILCPTEESGQITSAIPNKQSQLSSDHALMRAMNNSAKIIEFSDEDGTSADIQPEEFSKFKA